MNFDANLLQIVIFLILAINELLFDVLCYMFFSFSCLSVNIVLIVFVDTNQSFNCGFMGFKHFIEIVL